MPSRPVETDAVLEIKSGSFYLPVIFVPAIASMDFEEQLVQRMRSAPDFFRNTPVVLDLNGVANTAIDLNHLVDLIRQQGAIAAGIRSANTAHQVDANQLGLAVLSESGRSNERDAHNKTSGTKPAAEKKASEARIIDQPVRSGQRIYAADADLVVLAPVSAGAEIMADGNIHIYSTLRGRALAGVKGNLNSRIFCLDLQAELVSIAGHYKTSEQLDNTGGKPVQVLLDDQALLVVPL